VKEEAVKYTTYKELIHKLKVLKGSNILYSILLSVKQLYASFP